MRPLKRILVPVDWSGPSRRALALAAALARAHAAELVVLYVLPLPVVMYGPPPQNYLDHLFAELRCITPGDLTGGVHHLVAEGAPAAVIARTAGELRCDLIVLGTHGRTGLARLLMGSVAEAVLRRAPCPVLTVNDSASPSQPIYAPAPSCRA